MGRSCLPVECRFRYGCQLLERQRTARSGGCRDAPAHYMATLPAGGCPAPTIPPPHCRSADTAAHRQLRPAAPSVHLPAVDRQRPLIILLLLSKKATGVCYQWGRLKVLINGAPTAVFEVWTEEGLLAVPRAAMATCDLAKDVPTSCREDASARTAFLDTLSVRQRGQRRQVQGGTEAPLPGTPQA
eukprot:scaffold5034_cov385-Prasinococcus_capsulatus_cf.AAC.5